MARATLALIAARWFIDRTCAHLECLEAACNGQPCSVESCAHSRDYVRSEAAYGTYVKAIRHVRRAMVPR